MRYYWATAPRTKVKVFPFCEKKHYLLILLFPDSEMDYNYSQIEIYEHIFEQNISKFENCF